MKCLLKLSKMLSIVKHLKINLNKILSILKVEHNRLHKTKNKNV